MAIADRTRITILLDSEEALAALAAACRAARVSAGWLWEVECGTGRCGTEPGASTASLLARLAAATPAVEFRGLLAFAGHAYGAGDRDDLLAAAEDERRAVAETAEILEAGGCPVAVRSIGTTPTSLVRERAEGITELRPGNYVFNDATQVALGVATLEQCALSVLGTVVSRPDPQRLILDCGSKALGADRLTMRSPGFGRIVGEPDLVVERLYEEHAIVSSAEPSALRIGERVRIVPNHACAAVNLHARMFVTADGALVDEWPIAARGWHGHA
jgi:D-serine deaminase-like pyridoxal phosphate-dependent protein